MPDTLSALVYFAGKVRSPQYDYRSQLFHNEVMAPANEGEAIVDLCGTQVRYGGPTCINSSHHEMSDREEPGYSKRYSPATHGNGTDTSKGILLDEGAVIGRCLRQIEACDFVFAYLDDTTCYGTLAEIGYASAHGKPVMLVMPHDNIAETKTLAWSAHGGTRSDLWFVMGLPGVTVFEGEPEEFFGILRRRCWISRRGGDAE